MQSAGNTAHLLPQSALTLNDAGDLGVRLVGRQHRHVRTRYCTARHHRRRLGRRSAAKRRRDRRGTGIRHRWRSRYVTYRRRPPNDRYRRLGRVPCPHGHGLHRPVDYGRRLAYASLPKEGEPDIEIPALFVSVPFPGISAEDSEKLLVKPMETELADLDGLKTISGTAAEGYAGIALEFEFGWDKTKIMADVRDAMNSAEGQFPAGAEQYSINEINFSEFPIIIVNLTGARARTHPAARGQRPAGPPGSTGSRA